MGVDPVTREEVDDISAYILSYNFFDTYYDNLILI